MKKLIVALLLCIPLMALADGGTITVVTNETRLLVPQYTPDTYGNVSYGNVSYGTNGVAVTNLSGTTIRLWTNGVAFATGDVVRMLAGGPRYVAQIGGTSGSTLPAVGPYIVVDGTISWMKLPSMKRTGLVIQYVGGGAAALSFGSSGNLSLSTPGAVFTAAAPSCYDGAIYGSAVGSNVVYSVIAW